MLDAIAGGTPEASYPLIDALKSPSRDMRAQAAPALGERTVPIAVEPLVELLKDGEPSVRLQAVIALGRIGQPRRFPPAAAGRLRRLVPGLFGAAGAPTHR